MVLLWSMVTDTDIHAVLTLCQSQDLYLLSPYQVDAKVTPFSKRKLRQRRKRPEASEAQPEF